MGLMKSSYRNVYNVTFLITLLCSLSGAVDFIISKDCNDGDGLTSEGSYTTYRTTTSDHNACTAVSDRTLPRTVDYDVTISLRAYGGSYPALMFNIHDDNNYDMVYFRVGDYECVGIASMVDGAFKKHTNEHNTFCDGFSMTEGQWYQITIVVLANSFNVSVDGGAVWKVYPTQLQQKPSSGLLQALTYQTHCNNNECEFDFRSLDVLPRTHRDLHSTEHGTFVTPNNYHANKLYYHQVEFHQLGSITGKSCFVALHFKHIDIGQADIYIEDELLDHNAVGAIKFYGIIGPDLKVYFYSANMNVPHTGYTIDYHVLNCGVDNPELSYVCETGYHNNLYDDYFRSTAFVSDPSAYKSDVGMTKGWYRFESCAGDTLVTTTPASKDICGTRDPVWLNEQGSSVLQGLPHTEATACVFTSGNDCAEQWKVPVYICNDFLVYYLLPSTTNSGYCVGNRLYCDNSKNMTSVDGSGCGDPVGGGNQPCIEINMPEMTDEPIIGEWQESNNIRGLYNLPCTIQEPSNPPPHLKYDVEWLVDYGSHRVLLSSEKTAATTVYVESRQFLHEHLQADLICRARVYIQTGGHDLYGEWVESESKFMGLKIEKVKDLNIETDSDTIRFRFTIPFSCDGSICLNPTDDCHTTVYFMTAYRSLTKLACINFLFREPELLHMHGCSVPVRCDQWDNTHTHQITAKDTSQEGLSPYTHTLYAVTKDNRPTWNNVIATETVHIKIDRTIGGSTTTICTSNNDPHLTTFNKIKYDNHLEGEFILFRSKPEAEPDMETMVTAEYKHCRNNIACNVAVGVKVKNEAVIIDAQAVGSKYRYVGPGSGERGFELYGHGNMESFTIKLPRGEIVKVTMRTEYGDKWMNIQVKSLTRETQDSKMRSNGICGKLNVNYVQYNGDLTWRDGLPYSGSLTRHSDDIKEFSKHWETYANESIINNDNNFGANSSSAPSTFSCGIYEINDFLQSVDYLNGKPVIRSEPCVPYSTPCIEDESSECNLLDGLRKKVIEGRPSRTYSKRRGPVTNIHPAKKASVDIWTSKTANNYCQSYIGESPTAMACASVTPEQIDIAMEECTADIMLSNDTIWAKSTLTSLRELCIIELYNNLTLWSFEDSENGTEFKPPVELTENLCPGDCSGHGDCEDGLCQCHKEFIGYECSTRVDTPPAVSMVMEHVCYTTEKCDEIRIIGTDLIHGNGLTCHFVQDETDKEEPSRGYLLSYDFVVCPVKDLEPTSLGYGKYSLSISNDGVHRSERKHVAVVTAECVSCNQESENSEITCALTVGTCLIDNMCVLQGAASEIDVCQYCEPNLDQYQWTNRKGCGEGQGLNSLQIGMIVLGCTVLVAGVVIGTVFIRYRSKIRKVQPVDNVEMESKADVEEKSSDGNVTA